MTDDPDAPGGDPDRYVSFIGLDCDAKADRMLAMLDARLKADPESRWAPYFRQKLDQKARMGNDNLHFVGSQMNSLLSFFEEIGDAAALDLLWHLEQTCC